MEILYTANKKYIDAMVASIYSIYRNGGLDYINLHIIYSDFSLDDVIYIESFLKRLDGVKFNFYFLDEREIDKYNIPKWRGSQIANARLFFQSILKDKVPEKLLYIDADTICVGPLNELENYDKYPVYAVKDSLHDCYTQRFMNLDKYCNSGFMYIDTKKWSSVDAERKVVDFVSTSPWELIYPDQDIFNCALSEYIGELGAEYNLSPHVYLFDERELRRYYAYRGLSVEEVLSAKEKVKICHSYGFSGIKPWTNNNINPYNDLFMEYLLYVNPEFKKEDLSFKEMLVTRSKRLYKEWLLLRNNFSSMMVVERCPNNKELNKRYVELGIKK